METEHITYFLYCWTFLFFFSPPVCRHDSLKAEVFNNSKVFQVSFFAVDKKIPLIKVLPYITVFLYKNKSPKSAYY